MASTEPFFFQPSKTHRKRLVPSQPVDLRP
jgi:hypothetical protein